MDTITRSFARLYSQPRLHSSKTHSLTKNLSRSFATTSVCSHKGKYIPGKKGFHPDFNPGYEWYTRPINNERRLPREQKMRQALKSQILRPRDTSKSRTEASRYRSRLALVKRSYADQLISHFDKRDEARKEIQREEVEKRINIKDNIQTEREKKEMRQHDVLETLNLTTIIEKPDQADEMKKQHRAENREEHLGRERKKRLRMLLRIYHQSPKFITMENLDVALDEFFSSKPTTLVDDIGNIEDITPSEIRDRLVEERTRELREILDGVTIFDKTEFVGVDKVSDYSKNNSSEETVNENITT